MPLSALRLRALFWRSVACLGALSLACVAAAADRAGTYGFVVSGASKRVNAGFVDFARNPLTLSFSLDPGASRLSMAEFGYASTEIETIVGVCRTESCGQAELDRRVDAFYRDRAMVPSRGAGNSVSLHVDVPLVVRRNVARVRPVALEIERVAAERGYGSVETMGAALAFVQTALAYRRPPAQEGGRVIAEFYPPPRALDVGYGDCDTKSALLASVLRNFPGTRVVGVHVPGHYILGVAGVPRSGDAYVEYRGTPYVLVETSGPGMLPIGTITDATESALATTIGVRIEPLF